MSNEINRLVELSKILINNDMTADEFKKQFQETFESINDFPNQEQFEIFDDIYMSSEMYESNDGIRKECTSLIDKTELISRVKKNLNKI